MRSPLDVVTLHPAPQSHTLNPAPQTQTRTPNPNPRPQTQTQTQTQGHNDTPKHTHSPDRPSEEKAQGGRRVREVDPREDAVSNEGPSKPDPHLALFVFSITLTSPLTATSAQRRP